MIAGGAGEGAGAEASWLYRFHLGDASVHGVGVVDVRRGGSWRARCLCALLRLPGSGETVPLTVRIVRSPGRELWSRRFGSRELTSRQLRSDSAVRERKGPLELRMRAVRHGPDLTLYALDAWPYFRADLLST